MVFNMPRNYGKSCTYYSDNGSEVEIIYPALYVVTDSSDGSITINDIKFTGNQAQAIRELLSAERARNIRDAGTAIEKWLDKLIVGQLAQADIAKTQDDELHCNVCNLTADIIETIKTGVQPILYKSLIKESIQSWRQTDERNQV